MSKEPHGSGLLDKYPYVAKSDVLGTVVCVLDARSEERGMELTIHPSRALCRHEIHELAITDESEAAPGLTVNKVAYLAFFAVEEGGIVLQGDEVFADEHYLGRVVGFDLTHFPNHLNVVAYDQARQTGLELDLKVGDLVTFSSTL
jgi:hypothetical protein